MQIFCSMLKKYLSIIIFFSSISIHINAQELDYFDYEREILWGINKNTNGGLIRGGVLKFSNKIAEKLYSTIGVELVNVKHSKENKYSSALGYGRTFIWAKQNYFFSFRGQYGREMILFSKKDQQYLSEFEKVRFDLAGTLNIAHFDISDHILYKMKNKGNRWGYFIKYYDLEMNSINTYVKFLDFVS